MSLVVGPATFLDADNLVVGHGDPTLFVGLLILKFLTGVLEPLALAFV